MKRMLSLVLAAALLAGCAARGDSAAGEAGAGAASPGGGAAASKMGDSRRELSARICFPSISQ